MAATFRRKGLFFGIYKFKFYPKTEFLNFYVFLCDFEKMNKKKILKKKFLTIFVFLNFLTFFCIFFVFLTIFLYLLHFFNLLNF